MDRYATFWDVISAFGGEGEALARVLGCDCSRVRQWKYRGIPAGHWQDIVRLAEKAGIDGVTLDLLVSLASRPIRAMRRNPAAARPKSPDEMQPNERLRAAREARGFRSAAAFARANGLRLPGYSHHENGTRGMSLQVVQHYADLLDVDAAWLSFAQGRGPAPASTEEAA